MYWFVGGDRRAYWTVEHLRKKGLPLCVHGVPDIEDQPLPEHIPLLLLPFPLKDPWQWAAMVKDRIREESLVIGGYLGRWGETMKQTGARIVDLCDREPLPTLNAVATAEGAIALLIEGSEITLWEAECLVIGGGRIGMLLGQRLRALGGKVTVSARGAKDLAMIRGQGMATEITGHYERGLGQYDFVINTVPAPVLGKKQLQQLKTSCVLMELASAPGGFSREETETLGIKGIFASGLPGRFSPKTAGCLYGDCLMDALREEGVL